VTDIDVRVDDLAFFEGEAIIRPVNAELRATTASLRRLEIVGGPALDRHLRVTEPLEVGSAVVTGAGDLEVELIVHAVISSPTERVTARTVRRALQSALERAKDFAIGTVAMPPFGLGAGNLDIEESAHVMLEVLSQHFARGARHPSRVVLVVESEDEADAVRTQLGRSAR